MILVTGGFGSIGAHTALALADLDEHVVITWHRKAAPPSFLEGRVAVEQADLADLDAVRAIGDRHQIKGIRPPRGRRSRGAGRNRVHAQEHRDAAQCPRDPYLDITRLTRDTGFEPAFDVRAGVADYVAWLRENPS
jgi:nucleoside-diphosphate-sugar epimerase